MDPPLQIVSKYLDIICILNALLLCRGTGEVTNGTSVQELLAGSSVIPPLAGIPEFAIWSKQFGSGTLEFNVTFSRTLLNGTS